MLLKTASLALPVRRSLIFGHICVLDTARPGDQFMSSFSPAVDPSATPPRPFSPHDFDRNEKSLAPAYHGLRLRANNHA